MLLCVFVTLEEFRIHARVEHTERAMPWKSPTSNLSIFYDTYLWHISDLSQQPYPWHARSMTFCPPNHYVMQWSYWPAWAYWWHWSCVWMPYLCLWLILHHGWSILVLLHPYTIFTFGSNVVYVYFIGKNLLSYWSIDFLSSWDKYLAKSYDRSHHTELTENAKKARVWTEGLRSLILNPRITSIDLNSSNRSGDGRPTELRESVSAFESS